MSGKPGNPEDKVLKELREMNKNIRAFHASFLAVEILRLEFSEYFASHGLDEKDAMDKIAAYEKIVRAARGW